MVDGVLLSERGLDGSEAKQWVERGEISGFDWLKMGALIKMIPCMKNKSVRIGTENQTMRQCSSPVR